MTRVIITPLILLYSPIGLFLVLIRSLLIIYVFLASAILYSVPPLKRVVLRLMCSFLGFVVTSEGRICGSSKQPFVSNCATLFDHMVLSLLTNCVTPHKFMLSWALTWRPLNYDESDCINRISDVFHIQPEETPTGPQLPYMLKFNSAPFRLFNAVQPVAISVTTTLPIHLSVHPIDWKYEIFWLLFSPVVRVHVKFLEPMNKSMDSCVSDESFADMVRQEIAKNLNKKIVDWDKHRINTMQERVATTEESETNTKPTKGDDKVGDYFTESDLDTKDDKKDTNNCNKYHISERDPRVDQVLAVIPNGSRQMVEKLLKEIGDVEEVIARMLEHPDETDVEGMSQCKGTVSKYLAPSCHRVAANNFSRNTDERHRSFADRKAIFLENARLRYLEVHCHGNKL